MSLKTKLLEFLKKNNDELYSFEDLLNELSCNEEELQDVLNTLEQEGIIYLTKRKKQYCLCEAHGLVKAKIVRILKNYAILEAKDEDDETYSIRVSLDDLNGAIYLDTVLVSKPTTRSAYVYKVLSHEEGTLVGEYMNSKKDYIIPDDKNYEMRIFVDKNKSKGAHSGHKVVFKIIKFEPPYMGEVVEILGHKNDPKVDIMSLVHKHKVPAYFPSEVMQEVESMSNEISKEEIESRLDLRDHLICTIDGEDAKDLDDAIEVYKNEDDTYTLGVHIADVSHYVKEGNPIDKEAFNRGTSVYMVDYVIPMLPHALCNGLCSLNPFEDKLSMSCIMKINKEGEILDYTITPSIINSKKRFTYTEVNKFLKGKISFNKELDKMLTDAIELSYILRKKREERGALDLDVDEAKIIVDKQGKPLDIVLRDRDDAEKLIEDFMVFANECVATHIYWQNLPFVYRIHDKPKTEKIMNFSRLIRPLGYLLKGENNGIHPKELQSLLNRIKDDNVKDVISSLMLRSLAKAKYDIKNVGHFGLASDCYTHFTSPIRRYPDLMVHRLLKLYSNYEASYDLDELYEKTMYQAEQSSIYERRAVSLERDVESMKMAEYMEDKVGYVYVGRITGMIQTGFFVSLDNLIEGMIRFDTMKDDYYNYDEKRMVIVGEGSKKVLKLGDKIKVKVKSASKQSGQIDFYFLRKM